MNVAIVGGDALVTNEFWQISGPAGEGTIMTFPPDPRKIAGAASIVAEFKAKNFDPEGYTLYTYAAIQVWAAAAAKTNSLDVKKLSPAIRGQKFNTVIGDLQYDNKGDVSNSKYVFYIWDNGEYHETKVGV